MSKQSNIPGFAAWEKWSILSVVILGLASVIVWFNIRTFGLADGLPYCAVVAFVCLVSFITTRHIKRNPVTTNFLKGAFLFEILLTVALGINCAYSLSVMREMSVAGQTEERQTENLKTMNQTVDSIGKLTSPSAQRAAARALEAQQRAQTGEDKPSAPPASRSAVFAAKERILFWILIGELATAMLATFVLLGLSIFDRDANGIPDFLERSNSKQQVDSIAQSPSPVPAVAYGQNKPVIAWRGGKQIDNARPQ